MSKEKEKDMDKIKIDLSKAIQCPQCHEYNIEVLDELDIFLYQCNVCGKIFEINHEQ